MDRLEHFWQLVPQKFKKLCGRGFCRASRRRYTVPNFSNNTKSTASPIGPVLASAEKLLPKTQPVANDKLALWSSCAGHFATYPCPPFLTPERLGINSANIIFVVSP